MEETMPRAYGLGILCGYIKVGRDQKLLAVLTMTLAMLK